MFCSKCGKTLTPDAERCPHCGTLVGESRFEGNGYTAAQQRFISGDTEDTRSATPYTRTTYTSMDVEDEASPDSIYSRTTYRPILKDAPTPVEPEVPKEQSEDETSKSEHKTELRHEESTRSDKRDPTADKEHKAQKPSDNQDLSHVGVKKTAETAAEADASVVIAPLKPIRKTGISPEVEQYIKRMNETKGRKANRAAKEGNAAVASDADTAVLDQLARASAPKGIVTEIQGQETERETKKGGMPSWLKPALIILCVAIILGTALYFIAMNVGNRSQLEGVSYDLRHQGLALIKTRTLKPYREPLARMLLDDQVNGAQNLVAAQQQSHTEIQKLLPEQQAENDKKFVDALDHIQSMVDNAVMMDAFALANRNDPALGGLADDSNAAWEDINNSILRLENAKENQELDAIIRGTIEALATPAPLATPEPPKYQQLQAGMNNNREVKRMQNALTKLGWFNSQADGDFGPVTVTAVKKFQQAAGLNVDGVADEATLELLYSDNPPKFSRNQTAAPSSAPTLASGGGNQIIDPEAAEPEIVTGS